MPNFYSQNGEDYLLSLMFQGISDGFFVEIGCIDGKRFSNSLHFEENGWKGICVEAHPDFIDALKLNRPASTVVHCAIGESNEEEVIFYCNKRGSLSSLDPTTEKHFRENYSEYFFGFEERKVSKRTLTSVFNENLVKKIDFLSLDIEGYELHALRGLDFKRYRPRVFVIEIDNGSLAANDIDSLLKNNGYFFAGQLANNYFYTNEVDLASLLKNVNAEIQIKHMRHPIDSGPDFELMNLHIQIPLEARILPVSSTKKLEATNHIMKTGQYIITKLKKIRKKFNRKKVNRPIDEYKK